MYYVMSVSYIILNRCNQKYNSILVQTESSLVPHSSAYVILNRRVRNINIEINLPNESIAGDNCIAETSHDAELLYTVKTDYTYRGLRFLLATSLRSSGGRDLLLFLACAAEVIYLVR